MRIKHTYLFTMLVGLLWVGLLFGHQQGPLSGGAGVVTGAFPGVTCNQAQCHNSYTLNSGPGTLSVAGLPAQWTPGTTYPLTITVPKASSSVTYGFQISAVFNSNTPPKSAGTLSKGKTSGTDSTRISVLTDQATGIQVVEHNLNNASLAPTQIFYVNWTAPANATGGSVRFNVAGNAANGDVTPTGDYIYTYANVVAPAVSAPPDFSLSAASTASLTAGGNTTVPVTVSGANGFSSDVSLTVTGAPAGVTTSFDTSTVAGGSGTANLAISTTTLVTAGVYPLTVTGTSGSLTHSATVSLTINAPVGSPSRTFTVQNRGGTSSISSGAGTSIAVGYGDIQPGTSATTPSGVAIFGFRQSNTLVSEVGVPATQALTSGRIYAEIAGVVDAGIAIANPNAADAILNFYYTDANGNPAGSGTYTVTANHQVAKFLDQAPFNVFPGSTFQGTFSFTSNVPVAVVALRGFTNERSEFLMSTLPVIDTTIAPTSGNVVVPHFADGGGWTTQVLLVNPTDNAMTGTVQFVTPAGGPASVTIGGQTNNSFSYSVPKRTSTKLATAGLGASTASGSIVIAPAAGGPAPTALVLFSFKPAGITVSQAGVPVSMGSSFRLYVEAAVTGNIESGIAVANTSTTQATVTFDVTDLTGAPVSGIAPVPVTLAGGGQSAKFLSELFPSLPSPFKGVLRVTTSGAGISVVGLRTRTNERNDFLITTTPPSNEASPSVSAAAYFPQIADGGGYTTQFILFSGIAGQTTSGTLFFFGQDGTPLFLALQ